MARGSGLSIDSDLIGSFLLHKPIVLNSFPEEHNNDIVGSGSSSNNDLNSKLGFAAMDSTVSNKRSSPTRTIPFQVNLNCHHDHQDSSDDNHKRIIIDEMDFFSDKKNRDDDDDKVVSASADAVEKHDCLRSATPTLLDFKVNVSDPFIILNSTSCRILIVFFIVVLVCLL